MGEPDEIGFRGHFIKDNLWALEDDGPGVPERVRERLFQPFVTGARGGTGLGLAIVKHVAMAHGGRAEVQSQPGSGSRFSLVLPRRYRVSRMSPGKPGTSRPRAGEAAD